MFYVLKCVLFLLASFLKCFLSFELNFLYASGFPAKKPLSLVSEFSDLIFILNFVYASKFVFYVAVYTKTIRQLGLVFYEQIVDSGFTLVDYLLIDNSASLSNC